MSNDMQWIAFNKEAYPHEELPLERRYVLVQIERDDDLPPSVAVGYLRLWSDGPFFVVPGFARPSYHTLGGCRPFLVTHWCDSLGDNFGAPLWKGKQTSPKRSR